MRKKTHYCKHSELNRRYTYHWDMKRDGGDFSYCDYYYYVSVGLSKDKIVKLRDRYRR